MAKRPSKIKVGPHTYKIYYSKKKWARFYPKKKNKEGYGGVVGRFLLRASVILVNGWEQSLSQQKDTLLHEILHACFALTVFDNSPISFDGAEKSEIEEYAVLILTPTLLQVLQDNPELVEWLTSSD